MDITALLRTLGGLGVVLGMLGAALWIVRRYDIALPGRVGAGVGSGRRVAVIERVQLDAKGSLVLMRRDDREHLFVLLPDRVAVIETGIAPRPMRRICRIGTCADPSTTEMSMEMSSMADMALRSPRGSF